MESLANLIIGAIVAVGLWSARSYIIGNIFDWMKKLFLIIMIDAIFRAITFGYLDGLRIMIIYFNNMFLYKLLPESTISFIMFIFILFLTFDIIIWIIGSNHLPDGQSTRKERAAHDRFNRKPSKGLVPMPSRGTPVGTTGFTSRPIV